MTRAVRPRAGARLRILATSDLHAHVFPYDYYADRPAETVGLARTASLVAEARREVPESLLFDNGDFLNGSPLADAEGARPDRPHPMVAAMNALGYDAAALGNHEFDQGLDSLARALEGAAFPVTCANLTGPAGAPLPGIAPWLVLPRRIRDAAGRAHPLGVGVVGVLPPQVLRWDGRHLAGRACARDMVGAVRAALPALRRAGADIVVVLAHSGIGPAAPAPAMENAATAIAGLDGVDAVVAGHSHLTFPGPGWSGAAVDGAAGTLRGKPAVMPGFWGSHLGVIDLDLDRDGAGWRVAGGKAALRAIAGFGAGWRPAPLVPSLPAVLNAAARDHADTLRRIRRPVGRTEVPLQSFFARVADTAAVQVVARAQRDHVAQAMRGTRHEGLPVLSAAAPFRAGGRGGPGFYTDIPAGELALRHLSELYPFPNLIRALLLTGAGVAEWLERSASAFRRIEPGRPDQPLVDEGFPSYDVDSILGVTYRIDLSQPARYDAAGRLADPAARRIRDLSLDGAPLAAGTPVILATNSYRTGGGGAFPGIETAPLVLEGYEANRDLLVAHVAARGVLRAERRPSWRFAPVPGASAVFDSAPAAALRLDSVPQLAIEPAGESAGGFARFRIRL